jgi:hypothetical protein
VKVIALDPKIPFRKREASVSFYVSLSVREVNLFIIQKQFAFYGMIHADDAMAALHFEAPERPHDIRAYRSYRPILQFTCQIEFYAFYIQFHAFFAEYIVFDAYARIDSGKILIQVVYHIGGFICYDLYERKTLVVFSDIDARDQRNGPVLALILVIPSFKEGVPVFRSAHNFSPNVLIMLYCLQGNTTI